MLLSLPPPPPQTERAYQKQPTIFQNKKRVLLGEGGKEKLPRYYKNIGLGFKTPKEVRQGRAALSPAPVGRLRLPHPKSGDGPAERVLV